MARLPSREDLGRRTPTGGTRSASIPSANPALAGMARGADALSRGIASLAGTIQDEQAKVDDYETRKRLLDFELEQENALEESLRTMQSGAPGFADGYTENFKKAAKRFVGKSDENIPVEQRGAVGLRLKQIERNYRDRAYTVERAERDRHQIEALETTLGRARDSVGMDPDTYAARLKAGHEVVDLAKLKPDDKARLKLRFGIELDKTAVGARIDRATSAEDFERIKTDLGVAARRTDTATGLASQLIVNSEARRDSKGRLQVYQIPAGDGGGRYEVAGINERYHPEAARELKAMVESGQSAKAEAYARRYIKQYTQGSADLVKGEAAQYVVRDMAFNRGPGGANAALRMAIGIVPGSKAAAHRPLTAAEREKVEALASSDPAGFVRSFSTARAGYEYRFVGVRPQFDKGLQNRWSQSRDNALKMLTGEISPIAETADGSDIEPVYGNLDFAARNEMWHAATKRRQALVKAVDDEIDELEKNAATGKFLPPEIMGAIKGRVEALADPVLEARYQRTVGLAGTIQQMQGQTLVENEGALNQLTTLMPNPTPEQREQLETLKKVVSGQREMLDSDALTWAHRTQAAGIKLEQLDPTAPTFTKQIQARAQQAQMVAARYGITPQYFTKSERAALGDFLGRGGPQMTQFLGQLYQGFGTQLGEVVRELAPKQPELARAGMLMAHNGDPQAITDIATTLKRRSDPNYTGGPKVDKAQAEGQHETLFGDFYARLSPSDRDATVKAAQAIYEARVKDPAEFDSGLYEESLRAALGQRTVGANSYGGLIDTKLGWSGFNRSGDKIMLPSDVRRDGWRALLDSITEDDMREAGLPTPIDGNGQPISMTKAVNGRIVQVAPGVYHFAFGDPTGTTDTPRWVMAGGPMAPDGSFRGAQDYMVPNALTPFQIDLNKLGPLLRRRLKQYFLPKE